MIVLKNNKGSATIETAVMFLLLIMLLTGFIYFINGVTVYSVLQVAAREGAREYSLSDSESKAIKKVKMELKSGGIDPKDVNISTKKIGNERQMTVDTDYNFYIPIAGSYDLKLQGGATFRAVRYLRD